MDHFGMIAVRPLSELIKENASEVLEPEIIDFPETPKKFNKRKNATNITKRRTHNVVISSERTTKTKSETKKQRPNRKEPLPGQLRIDSFYNSAAKTYKISNLEPKKEQDSVTSSVRKKPRSTKKPKRRKKALFLDDESTTSVSENSDFVINTRRTKFKVECVIDLCSDGEEDKKIGTSERQGKWPNNDGVHLEVERRCKMRFGALLDTIEEDTTTVSIQQMAAPITTTQIDTSYGEQIRTKLVEEEASKPNTVKRKARTKRKKTNEITADESNCDKNIKSVNKTLEDTVLMPPKNNSNETKQIEKRSAVGKASKNLEESTKSKPKPTEGAGCSKWLQKIKKDQISNPRTIPTPVAIDQNPTNMYVENQSCRKTAPSSNGVLSPSDSNISVKSHKKCAFSSKNPNSIKLPTPPQTISQSSTVTYELPLKITKIWNEGQENHLIKKPSKSKKNGKLDFKIEEMKPKRTRRIHPLPPYKVVEGTSFAVDAFRYGDIKDVTHYFLTHFHADHYIGLTRNFAYPVYMSSITANLIRVFIPLDEEFIKEIALNEPFVLKDIEITAIDANHCPGAIMLIFKTRSGRCTLHTGDFRACAQMESEPIFWNNDIHTIYLDTTYIPNKYAFCNQEDSIERALQFVREFHEKNVGTRILYVCGSYLVGKEKFWTPIAQQLSFKVWMEDNRRKAQYAIKDGEVLSLLVDDPCVAQLHIIPMVHISYFSLLEYIEKFSAHFDLLFALRPSGWEKNSKPQFRGKVNIVGIEYSEHSSHDELKRFVQYIKPQKVISTVPVTQNPMRTPKIPDNWYRYDKLTGMQRDFQTAITSYFKLQGGGGKEETPTVVQKPVPVPAKESSPVSGDRSSHINDIKSPVPDGNSGFINDMFISPMSDKKEEESEKLDKKPQLLNANEEDDWLS